MTVPQTGSFYASLADGEYRVADLPRLKDQWERGETPTVGPATPLSPDTSAEAVQMREVTVIVHGGQLAGIRVGDGEPIDHFARSRDAEYKWIES